jgi:hypothetical protein
MKRSSMLKKITKLLKSWEGSYLNGETSKEILDLIEKEGMLPPLNYHSFYNDGDNADEKSIIYRTWEEDSR